MIALDLRSLALARILTGLIVLVDLIFRCQSFRAHYTRHGVLPEVLNFEHLPDIGFPSLYQLNDTWLFVGTILLLHGAVAVAMTFGYQTRQTTVLCWYLTASLQYKNVLVNNGGDILLRLLLFWGMILPWGRRFSIDSLEDNLGEKETQVANVATFLLIGQMSLLYFSAALNKWHPIWIEDGTAIYYSLSVDHITTEYSILLYKHPWLMNKLSFLVVGTELLAGFVIWLPFVRFRLLFVSLLTLMHLSFGLFLEIGIFRYSPLIGLVALLPGVFWDRMPKWRVPIFVGLRSGLSRLGFPQPSLQSTIKSLPRPVAVFFAGWFIYGVLGCAEGYLKRDIIPRPIHLVGEALGVSQHWPMFSYLDQVKDGWYVLDATLPDGSKVDLLTGTEVDWTRPRDISQKYPGQRWRRYLTNVMLPPYQALLPRYSEFLRKTWSQNHQGAELQTLTIFFVNDPQDPSYRYTPPQRWTLDVWKKPEGEKS